MLGSHVANPDALARWSGPVAGQQSTIAWAINDLNAFTGVWYDANGAEHGFVALAVRETGHE